MSATITSAPHRARLTAVQERTITLLHAKRPPRPGKLRRAAKAEAQLKIRLATLKPKAPRKKKKWDHPNLTPTRQTLDLSRIPVGKPIKFVRTDVVYQKTEAGNVKRIYPIKPYRNRAEQKQWKKERRLMRSDLASGEEAIFGTYEDLQRTSGQPSAA